MLDFARDGGDFKATPACAGVDAALALRLATQLRRPGPSRVPLEDSSSKESCQKDRCRRMPFGRRFRTDLNACFAAVELDCALSKGGWTGAVEGADVPAAIVMSLNVTARPASDAFVLRGVGTGGLELDVSVTAPASDFATLGLVLSCESCLPS